MALFEIERKGHRQRLRDRFMMSHEIGEPDALPMNLIAENHHWIKFLSQVSHPKLRYYHHG